MAVLRRMSAEVGATPTQVVPAWLVASKPSIVPVTGASSVAQLDEQPGGMELRLDAEIMARLGPSRT